ncbi:MAG: hypothetical protein KGH58_00540 [Candidatus Micrarchaeota archaeon]|nr:hypothetical protein [Candidatus Micrarchaeota archaeon]
MGRGKGKTVGLSALDHAAGELQWLSEHPKEAKGTSMRQVRKDIATLTRGAAQQVSGMSKGIALRGGKMVDPMGLGSSVIDEIV